MPPVRASWRPLPDADTDGDIDGDGVGDDGEVVAADAAAVTTRPSVNRTVTGTLLTTSTSAPGVRQARAESIVSDEMFDRCSSMRSAAARWFVPTTFTSFATQGTGSVPVDGTSVVIGSSSPQPSDTASTSA